jgi:hypothetical protein
MKGFLGQDLSAKLLKLLERAIQKLICQKKKNFFLKKVKTFCGWKNFQSFKNMEPVRKVDQNFEFISNKTQKKFYKTFQ